MPRPDVSDLRREQILNAALALFSKKGIDSTSMNEIAKQCELSKATIYHYFDSKDEMVLALLESIFVHDDDAFVALQNPELSVTERLMTYVGNYAETILGQPQLFALFFEFYGNSIRRESIRETLSSYFDNYTKVFTNIFQEGFDEGEFQEENAQLVAESFMALLEGTVIMSFIRKLDLANSMKQSAQLFLNNLR